MPLVPIFITEEEVEVLLPMSLAIDAVRDGFRWLAAAEVVNGTRLRTSGGGAMLTTRMAIAPPTRSMGLKVYPIVRTDVTQGSAFTFLLYELPSGRLEAVIEADLLGRLRTGAASAVAASVLAPQKARTLGIFGTGWQARYQVDALLRAVPSLQKVLVVGRSRVRREEFASMLSGTTHRVIEVVEAGEAATRADIIVTATGSAEPVFPGNQLGDCRLIIAMGSNFAEKRELDKETIRRAELVVVDSIEVARVESGDLIRNEFRRWDEVTELGSWILEGRTLTSDGGLVIFESHGLGIQDLACATRVGRDARRRNMGIPLTPRDE